MSSKPICLDRLNLFMKATQVTGGLRGGRGDLGYGLRGRHVLRGGQGVLSSDVSHNVNPPLNLLNLIIVCSSWLSSARVMIASWLRRMVATL